MFSWTVFGTGQGIGTMRQAAGRVLNVASGVIGFSTLLSASSIHAIPEAPVILSVSNGVGLYSSITTGTTIERYLADLVQPIRSNAADSEGLTAVDVARERRRAQAESRAGLLGEVMRYDLNGDTVVTRDEVRDATSRFERSANTVDALFDRYDANGDGRITIAEIYAASVESGREFRSDRLDALLSLDPNRDKRLTLEELTKLGRAAFAAIDTDGNGIISQAEYQASEPLRRQWMEADRRMQMEHFGPRCPLPPVTAGAQVIALGIYDAPALSSVSIGGSDVATDFTLVHIEKGGPPLYVVLTSYESMVWKFDGDVGRVQEVIATSYTKKGGMPAVGVAGVKPDRVAAIRGDCLRYFYDPKSMDAVQVRGVLTRSLGRAPDQMVGIYSARSFSLASGAIEQADRNATIAPPLTFDPQSWSDALRFWPAGIAAVDGKAVVSKLPVAPYDIFPSQAGISQLLGKGAMVRDSQRSFRIVKSIAHFPARMTGAHSETLIIGKDVPMPSGDPGHSCVKTEDGSVARISPMCR